MNEEDQFDFARRLFPQREFALIPFLLRQMEHDALESLRSQRGSWEDNVHQIRAVHRLRQTLHALAAQAKVPFNE